MNARKRRAAMLEMMGGGGLRLGPELMINGGFETAGGGGTDVFANWTEFLGTGSLTRETTIVNSGGGALKFLGDGTGTTLLFQAITVVPGAKYRLQFKARGNDISNGVRFRIYDQTNAANIIDYTSAGVGFSTYTNVELTFTAPAGCTAVRIYFAPGVDNGATGYVDDVSVKQILSGTWQSNGAVSIQFDDGLASVYNTAFPLMQARGLKGTVYITSSWIGSAGYLTQAQILELAAAGWDMGNHTVTHPDLRTLSVAQQEAEFTACRDALDAMDLTGASRHVAYPSGWYNADTLTAMSNTGMLTGRISNTGSISTIDPPDANIFEISSLNPWNLTVGKQFVSDAFLNGGVYAFHQHDIGVPTDYSVADFTAWLDYIVTMGIRTMNITELYQRLIT